MGQETCLAATNGLCAWANIDCMQTLHHVFTGLKGEVYERKRVANYKLSVAWKIDKIIEGARRKKSSLYSY